MSSLCGTVCRFTVPCCTSAILTPDWLFMVFLVSSLWAKDACPYPRQGNSIHQSYLLGKQHPSELTLGSFALLKSPSLLCTYVLGERVSVHAFRGQRKASGVVPHMSSTKLREAGVSHSAGTQQVDSVSWPASPPPNTGIASMHCPFWLLQNVDSRNQTEVLVLASPAIRGPKLISFL